MSLSLELECGDTVQSLAHAKGNTVEGLCKEIAGKLKCDPQLFTLWRGQTEWTLPTTLRHLASQIDSDNIGLFSDSHCAQADSANTAGVKSAWDVCLHNWSTAVSRHCKDYGADIPGSKDFSQWMSRYADWCLL